eukprot:gnl/MRDRNA2_/MRDRNA2_62547_c0_seq1.p1 gnl/MRDRNA2_/MRDRNA2_62547_c0~~gnl/MRDRNA2_/MRDRNA2_62547_c0_seq1.p1  ORF type:complete len:506 (+),score=52.59 gnl/MRDRNA2_/MRDRNA2_62547_c0_seq1:103-1620(+)
MLACHFRSRSVMVLQSVQNVRLLSTRVSRSQLKQVFKLGAHGLHCCSSCRVFARYVSKSSVRRRVVHSLPSSLSGAIGFGNDGHRTLLFKIHELSVSPGGAYVVERDISFQELKSITGLHARDVWALQGHGSNRALIQPRGDHAVLLQMPLGMFSAVLTADRCMIFGATVSVQKFAEQSLLPIANGVGDSEHDFELSIIEAVLQNTWHRLQLRTNCFTPSVQSLLEKLTFEEPEQSFSELTKVHRALVELQRKNEGVTRCIEQVLQSDDEMLSLRLTAKRDLPPNTLPDASLHTDVESLLEMYHHAFTTLNDQLFGNISALESAQVSLQSSLASKRTRLLQLDVHLSIATVSLGSMAVVAGLFGMNLTHGYEEAAGVFHAVTGGTVCGGILMYAIYMKHLTGRENKLKARLQRMTQAQHIVRQMPDLTDTVLKNLSKTQSDSSNSISLEEFQKLMEDERIANKVTTEEIQLLFQALDEDDNGVLELGDIVSWLCHQSASANSLIR